MILLYCIGALLLGILVVAAFIGTAWRVDGYMHLDCTPEIAWQHIGTLKALSLWSPWAAKDPAIRQTFTGTDGTIGAAYHWESEVKNVGAGSQTITGITQQTELTSRVDFIRPFKGTGQAFVNMKVDGGLVFIHFSMKSATPYPMNIIKLFGVIEKNMHRDFDDGFARLKALCEKGS